ncbi:protein lin-28 homolog A-like isoform X2 [Ptychodera flava]|uniref:protein lin-28 homolog A-like isoform X2 n=1 Tax=Ptychodera flava TaxID=63121 RepID=UPI00396A738B
MQNCNGVLDGAEAETTGEEKKGETEMTKGRGKCKWFNVAKGYGFITVEDGTKDIFVHQSVIKMGGFRSLGEGEPVEFKYKKSQKGWEALTVTGPEGADCQGSKRRPRPKYRRRVNRCYNCGEMGHHAKNCSLPPQKKKCHQCGSEDHLVADCPLKEDKKKKSKAKPNGNSTENQGHSEHQDERSQGASAAEGTPSPTTNGHSTPPST